MATVNSFKVKNVSSIDLPIQINSNKVVDDYTEIGTAYAAIRQLDRNINTVQQNLNKEIADLHTDCLAWERQHDGAVLKTSLDSGSTTSTRSLVIGEKNQVNTDVSNGLVLGIGNTANASNSLILGEYAKTSSFTLFAIGNGSDTGKESNIFEIQNKPNDGAIVVGPSFYGDQFLSNRILPLFYEEDSFLGTDTYRFTNGYIDQLTSRAVNISDVLRTNTITTQSDNSIINIDADMTMFKSLDVVEGINFDGTNPNEQGGIRLSSTGKDNLVFRSYHETQTSLYSLGFSNTEMIGSGTIVVPTIKLKVGTTEDGMPIGVELWAKINLTVSGGHSAKCTLYAGTPGESEHVISDEIFIHY